jgi:nitrite reductase/ring-hydroxylating ferredoxin subunit
MADNQRLICASESLQERTGGIRFALPERGERVSGFVVRYGGKPYAFVNQCAHVPVELDWNEGDFFDLTGHYVICATHGAHYEPMTGRCVMGPCKGRALQALPIEERDGNIYLIVEKRHE